MGASFLHILYEFHEIKLNVMKYTLNRVSGNSLKEIFHSVSSPKNKILLKKIATSIGCGMKFCSKTQIGY